MSGVARRFVFDALQTEYERKAQSDAARLEAALGSFDWQAWEDELRPILEASFSAVVADSADALADELRVVFNHADPFMQRELTKYVGERIVSLTETTRNEVSDLVRRVLDQPGPGPGTTNKLGDVIRDKVRQRFAGYEDWRADRIARTETAIAYNHGTVFACRQAGVDKVIVSDGGAGDVDPVCKEANGKIWTLQQALDNPVAHPNCTRAFSPAPEDV